MKHLKRNRCRLSLKYSSYLIKSLRLAYIHPATEPRISSSSLLFHSESSLSLRLINLKKSLFILLFLFFSLRIYSNHKCTLRDEPIKFVKLAFPLVTKPNRGLKANLRLKDSS